jgi:hypothetical protein
MHLALKSQSGPVRKIMVFLMSYAIGRLGCAVDHVAHEIDQAFDGGHK